MTTGIEERLRAELPELADLLARESRARVALTGPAQSQPPMIKAPRRTRGARPAVGVVAAVLVAAATVAAVLVAGRNDESPRRVEVVPALPGAPTGEWELLPDSPLDDREDAVAVWTGEEVIVWGGRRDLLALTDGAAYDPSTGEWRSIAPNTWGHPGAFGLWADDRMVVLAKTGGATYSPTTDTWTDLPRLGDDAGTMGLSAAVWTGDAVLAVGPRTDPTGQTRLGLVALDIDAGEWRTLATLDERVGEDFSVVASDSGLIVWSPDGSGGVGMWEYDVAIGAWGALPEIPVPEGSVFEWSAPVWFDGALHAVAGIQHVGIEPPPRGSLVERFDGGEWTVKEGDVSIGGVTSALPAGELVALLDEEAPGGPVVVDLRSGLWSALDDYPLDSVRGRSIVWTGDDLFVWGGRTAETRDVTPSSRTVAEGAIWFPDRP